MVERYQYSPYGEVTFLEDDFDVSATQESIIGNEFLYTGRRLDPETGLQYSRHRFYHPQLGRWINRDPIGYIGSPYNLYEYVQGRPLDNVDPKGLFPPMMIDDKGGWVVAPKVISCQDMFRTVVQTACKAWLMPGGRERCNRYTEEMRDRIVDIAPGDTYYDNDCFVVEYVDFKIPPKLLWIEHGGLKITWKKTGATYYLDNGVISGSCLSASIPAGWSEWIILPLDPPRGKPGYWTGKIR